MVSLALSGGMGILEHPAEPCSQNHPSILRLAIVQLLETIPGFQFTDFLHSLLGATTPKPTRLMVLNMADLPLFLCSHRLCPDPPRRAATGKNAEGEQATTHLKE